MTQNPAILVRCDAGDHHRPRALGAWVTEAPWTPRGPKVLERAGPQRFRDTTNHRPCVWVTEVPQMSVSSAAPGFSGDLMDNPGTLVTSVTQLPTHAACVDPFRAHATHSVNPRKVRVHHEATP